MSVWKVITRYSGQLLKAMDYGLPGYGEFYLRANTAWSIKYIIQYTTRNIIIITLYLKNYYLSFLKIILIKIFLSRKGGLFTQSFRFPSIVQRCLRKKKRGDLKGEKYNLTKKKKEKLLLIFFNSIQIPSSRPEFCNSDIISLNINEPINLHKNSSRR